MVSKPFTPRQRKWRKPIFRRSLLFVGQRTRGYHTGKPVPVLDRGARSRARAWGKRYITVTVWDYAD